MTNVSASRELQSVAGAYFQRKPAPTRIGLFCVGLNTYWPQFPGLREKLLVLHQEFSDMLRRTGAEVVDQGMADSSIKSGQIGDALRAADVDLVICNVVTYSTSSNALPAIQRCGRPAALVGLQPQQAMDYAQATTEMQLLNDNVTSLPEIVCAMRRANLVPADVIFGALRDDARAEARVGDLVRIGRVLRALRQGRIGLMGHIYEGMLDMNSDPTMFDAHFGMHVEHFELDDLHECVGAVSEGDVDRQLALVQELFHFAKPGSDPLAGLVDPNELRWATRVSVGMERFVEKFSLDALAYYYRGLAGNENERLGCSLIIGSSLLTGRGIPVAGEYDLKNCVAMLIMDRLGAGGSFAELHPADLGGDFVLVGHDGPHHMGIAEGKPIMRGLSVLHGKRGRGPSVEFAIKNGPITLLGITQSHDGRFKFVLAEGESLPGMIPATGNTNTRARFAPDVRTFLERWSNAGPTHHFALGIGHQAAILQRCAAMLRIECVNVTSR